MKRFFSACLLVAAMVQPALSANITNKDAEAAVLVIVEGDSRVEVAIAAGSTEALCPNGCFITTPSGDRIGLDGSENVDIVNGSAVVH
ncbi:putative cupin superfamily protein [Pararhizobium capsulatum DSM 1112]|uniref:Cupin superfamily protein n=1 Tax=Pararhizobium capsulatum DSM 1112 TaxID=1121113 RepID=A0ABU0BR43_9HYPH|nr:hypothetical protein [Pararhizobium capsulatum]MDQ0320712.1 putative cupin superfamily protein [Pararhizobium capsulatum DSM 1112]